MLKYIVIIFFNLGKYFGRGQPDPQESHPNSKQLVNSINPIRNEKKNSVIPTPLIVKLDQPI